jgi:PIN domain nuclease of toxin-antitoxin system
MGRGGRVIVLDTHVLIWWRSSPSRLSVDARAALEDSPTIAVSSISCWEVAMLVSRGRIRIDRDTGTWLRQALGDVTVVDVTCDVARAAGEMAERFPGDPADRLILSTARLRGGKLVTADRALRGYGSDDTIW